MHFLWILLNAHRSIVHAIVLCVWESVIAVTMHWFWLHGWLQWRYSSWPLPCWHRLVCSYFSFSFRLSFFFTCFSHRCTFHLRLISTPVVSLAQQSYGFLMDALNYFIYQWWISNWSKRIYLLINGAKCANWITHYSNCNDCELTTDLFMCCVYGLVWTWDQTVLTSNFPCTDIHFPVLHLCVIFWSS